MSQTGMEDNLYTADQFIEIFGSVIADALKKLRELQPSVEIVRCKDCKHFHSAYYEYNDSTDYWCGEMRMEEVTPTDFCSYGERKEDD